VKQRQPKQVQEVGRQGKKNTEKNKKGGWPVKSTGDGRKGELLGIIYASEGVNNK